MGDVAWIRPDIFGGHTKLNPTGRWRVDRYQNWFHLMIEHKGRFFKSWVYDCDIVFMPADFGTVFDCRNKAAPEAQIVPVWMYTYRPATSMDEAAHQIQFYESMHRDVLWQNGQPTSLRPTPWEIVMYYVGALEERVKELEAEKGAK